MQRRTFLRAASLAAGATLLASSSTAQAGKFTGKIRKSLKWGMVTEAKSMPLLDAFKKLRECGYEGVEPSLSHVPERTSRRGLMPAKRQG